MSHNYFTYIITNSRKTVLYTGVTNNLVNRIDEHQNNRGKKETFAGRYHCYNLLYFERFDFIEHAIEREKEIKGWSRQKKNELISEFNPTWRFLNQEILDL